MHLATVDGGHALTKPPLPKKPPKPDLRYVTEPSEKVRRLATHAMALNAWKAAKQYYDDVLYPAYRAEQLRSISTSSTYLSAAEHRDAKRRRVSDAALAAEAQEESKRRWRAAQAAIEESKRLAARDEEDAAPLLQIVREMWEELGFLSNDKLRCELHPARRASGKLEASRWSLALPAELRDIFPRGLENRGRFYDLYKVARREVKAERLAAGLTVDASNYERRQRIQMELGRVATGRRGINRQCA